MTTTYTVDTDGTKSYTSLNAAVTAAKAVGDHSGDDIEFVCEASAGSADTASVLLNTISNYTTITIKPATGQEHGGVWDASKYRHEFTATANGQYNILAYLQNVKITGLQYKTNTSAYEASTLRMELTGGETEKNIIYAHGNTIGIYGLLGSGTLKASANLIIGNSASGGRGIWGRYYKTYAYNNTCIDMETGYLTQYQTTVPKNNIAQGSTTGYSGTFDGGTNNLSSLADAPGANPIQATLTFTDAANDDYSLAASDTAATDDGVDLSADANYPVTTDIIGVMFGATPSVGAFQYVAGGGTTLPVFINHYRSQGIM